MCIIPFSFMLFINYHIFKYYLYNPKHPTADAASTMSQQRNLNNSFISLGLDQLLPKSRGRPYGSTTNVSCIGQC